MACSLNDDGLLTDSQIKSAMAAVVSKSLEDPELFNGLAQEALRKGTALGHEAFLAATRLANDPQVQQQALHLAQVAQRTALLGAGHSARVFREHIERGPAGVRVLGCGGACVSLLLAAWIVINPLCLFFFPSRFVVGVFQALMSTAMMVSEAPERSQTPSVLEWRRQLERWSPFLALPMGRGLLYIFLGALWLSLAGIMDLVSIVLGVYLIFIGTLHIGTGRGFTRDMATGLDDMGVYLIAQNPV